MDIWIIFTGTPGFTEAIGPFNSMDDAREWAKEAKILAGATIVEGTPSDDEIDRWWTPPTLFENSEA